VCFYEILDLIEKKQTEIAVVMIFITPLIFFLVMIELIKTSWR
jgi:hypothetical protein